MNNLLEQFLSEGRDFLQGIGEKLMQLEDEPNSTPLMTELFRFVHTLKGNSGLFEFPEMTRVLHASEDLMDAVRNGRVGYSQDLADQLLDAMDFVGMLMDEIEATGEISKNHAVPAAEHAQVLRSLLVVSESNADSNSDLHTSSEIKSEVNSLLAELPIFELEESVAEELYLHALEGETAFWVEYKPESDCFFKGEDPLFLMRQVPDTLWRHIILNNTAPILAEMDVYSNQLVFQLLTTAPSEELDDLFRYVPDEIKRIEIPALAFVRPTGNQDDHAIDIDFIDNALALLNKNNISVLTQIINTMLELSAPELWSSSVLRWVLRLLEHEPDNKTAQHALLKSLQTLTAPDWSAPAEHVEKSDSKEVEHATTSVNVHKTEEDDELLQNFYVVVNAQREILSLSHKSGFSWTAGRLKSIASTLMGCYRAVNRECNIDNVLERALAENSPTPLLTWLEESLANNEQDVEIEVETDFSEISTSSGSTPNALISDHKDAHENVVHNEAKTARRVDEVSTVVPKTLKVDQDKIDRLMNLIGEMVVAKNALPYLANRAETVFGVRDLSREIKAQYAVINRVAEEMQDTIMQVRMMPVSFIFQRFPRMVRDISRKLGKEVELVLEGESTEADKNIVEALSDPLIHIVRNSLDHGLEQPDVRLAAGKNATGKLTIRATQESDRVLIEIMDDGKGIDPKIIKHKAYEKGLIDETTLERISDQDAINLIFAAGFSTVEVISDLSGRGVGMDVVRSAVEKVNGTVGIESQVGKGTRIHLSLPLSMAVTNVIIIESNKQIFGVPMDMVVETVRVPRSQIRTIKHKQTTVLRGRVVPLLSLNQLLARGVEQLPNEDDEFATLIVRVHGEHIGILVDEFRETVDIILKPMAGILGGLSSYSGAALLGDGSVLMVLNPRELI